MNKLKATIFTVLFGLLSHAYAQTSVNKIEFTPETASIHFLEGISFTPDGILQKTESITPNMGEDPDVLKLQAQLNSINIKNEVVEIEDISPIQFKYAMMLDVAVESLKNISLLKFIEKWAGTKYRLGGTTGLGIDCSALTGTLLMAVYGFTVPRTAREQYKASDHIKIHDLTEGDLVFFNTHGGVSHVGLYLDNHYFFHSSSSQGVTISSLDDPYYAKRFICGGRVECD